MTIFFRKKLGQSIQNTSVGTLTTGATQLLRLDYCVGTGAPFSAFRMLYFLEEAASSGRIGTRYREMNY
jgi:hypothetical protein